MKLLERLRYADVPLDGVGLQSHLELEKGPFRENVYARFLQQIADLGLKITITELDVKEWDYTLSVERRDQRAADAVRALLSVVRDQPALRGITSWGLIDRYSWLGVTASDLARYPNAWQDGSSPGANRGLPLDASMKSKAMYQVISDLI